MARYHHINEAYDNQLENPTKFPTVVRGARSIMTDEFYGIKKKGGGDKTYMSVLSNVVSFSRWAA